MDLQCAQDEFSDDEIFMGRFTINEIKKGVCADKYRQTIGGVSSRCEDKNISFKIIETHSAPDILPNAVEGFPTISKSVSSPSMSPDTAQAPASAEDVIELETGTQIKSNNSKIQVKAVQDEAQSEFKTQLKIVNSNLQEITVEDKKELLLKMPLKVEDSKKQVITDKNTDQMEFKPALKMDISKLQIAVEDTTHSEVKTLSKTNKSKMQVIPVEDISQLEFKTPIKINNSKIQVIPVKDTAELEFKTPIKINNSKIPVTPSTPSEQFATPSNKFISKMPIYRTPGNPLSHRKPFITPSKKYQNVASPVANYINKGPIVPLVKDVCPRKHLPGMSSIPKPVKCNSRPNIVNKENIEREHLGQETLTLPSVAYRNAKETQMIDIPDEEKLPQNYWARQVASSIPKAVVIKHNHREIKSVKKPPQYKQEDSFADLSLHQADLSVCTKKSAFNKLKKNI